MQNTAKIGECNVRSCDSRQWDKTNKNDNILYLDIKTVYAANLGLQSLYAAPAVARETFLMASIQGEM